MSAFAQLSGHLGYEPELRRTNGGTPVVNLSVANNRSVKIGDTRESVADWFKVTVFGRDAEIIAQYAKKGSALVFNGRLQNEKWVDRDGAERTSTVLVASSFEFLPSKKGGEAMADEKAATKSGILPIKEEEDEPVPF
jgi:single-strand DNA-binding protein